MAWIRKSVQPVVAAPIEEAPKPVKKMVQEIDEPAEFEQEQEYVQPARKFLKAKKDILVVREFPAARTVTQEDGTVVELVSIEEALTRILKAVEE
jgi:hypothetical protein